MNSQFKIYKSTDIGAPQLSGTSGSLIAIFDACLVNGYGDKEPAGWDKPIPNESSSIYSISGSVIGCYRNISGSGMTLFINDNGPTGSMNTYMYREAWAIGWESLTNLDYPIGSGTQSFPTIIQQPQTSGGVVIRKSVNDSTTSRPWVMFADPYTFYFYALTGDEYYYPFWFGDFYSLKSDGIDTYRCFIKGRAISNSAFSSGQNSATRYWSSFSSIASYGHYGYNSSITPMVCYSAGQFTARNVYGAGTSISSSMIWDTSKTTFSFYSNVGYIFEWHTSGNGNTIVVPNPTDASLYITPLYIRDDPSGIRGRFRGIYIIGGNTSMLVDGQVLKGSGDYAGKEFLVIKGIESTNGGSQPLHRDAIHLIEISNTVETNDY